MKFLNHWNKFFFTNFSLILHQKLDLLHLELLLQILFLFFCCLKNSIYLRENIHAINFNEFSYFYAKFYDKVWCKWFHFEFPILNETLFVFFHIFYGENCNLIEENFQWIFCWNISEVFLPIPRIFLVKFQQIWRRK